MLHGIFTLLNSKRNNNIEISTILLSEFNDQNFDIDKKDFASIHISNRPSSDIEINSLTKSKVDYQLSGKIISEKAFLNSIEKIEIQTDVLDQIFYIKNTIKIKKLDRKEFNNISIYNYSKKNTSKIPKNMLFLKIELYIEIMNCEEPNDISLISEKYITL